MLKKLICCISAVSLLLSVIIPTSVFSVSATDYKAASGSNLLYGFDDATDISSQKWKTRWDNGGTAMQIALETNSANVYGGSGKSIKVTYDTSKKETINPSPAIWLDTTAITTSGDGITFWIKSEKATKIRIVAADKSYAKTLTIDGVEVKAGENLFFFKYSDFNNSSSADMSKLNQFQIRTDGNDAGTFYFDNFGFFSENDSDNQEEEWKKDLEAASGSNLLFGFDGITNVSEQKWTARFSNNGTAIKVDLETNASNAYGGSGKSLKVTYDCANKESSGNVPAIWTGDTPYTPKGDGITFWIKSEKETTLKFVMADKNWNAMIINDIEVKAGENLYFFRYSDFSNYASADLTNIKQIQIRTAANDAGTFYFDNFGFFSLNKDEEEQEDWTKDLEAANGENLLYSFDDVSDLSTQKWKPRWDNSGTALQMALESNSANVYSGSGKSIKVTYDSSKKESSGPPTIWVGDNAIIPKGDGITFWIKSEKATTIRLVTADKNWSTMTVDNIEVKAGENLFFFRYSDFSNYASADLSKLNQFQIRTDGNDAGTFYFDNFGFFELPKVEEPEKPKLPEGTAEILWDFDNYTTVESMNNAWQPHLAGDTGEGIKLQIESDAENVYGGVGKSLKVEYDRTKGTDTLPCIRHIGNVTTKGEGLIFWIKSAEDTQINFVGVDKNDKTVKTNSIDIKTGENIVVIKYSDIFASSGTADLSVLKQLQIRPAGSNKTGTYWLDSFGFYATPSVHDNDFFEFDIIASKWTKNSSSGAAYEFEKEAEHYHSGITDVKDNTSALKVSLKNLSDSNTNSVYYNAAIRVSEYEPYIYGEDSVLSFWIYSEQEVKLNVLYADKDAENKDVMSASKELIVPAGESIFRIPMKELVKNGTSPMFKQVYQLQFRFFSSEGTKDVSKSDVWIDAIGFYDSNPDVNPQGQTVENGFVWWNFDGVDTAENCGWYPRWAGENGKGLTLSLDDTAENTYGGSGKSLKAVYKTAESDNGQPTIWLGDNRMTMYGEGITFWIKSENQTKIRLVGIDADGNTVVTDYIPLKIGENIVTVKWDDFSVSGKPEIKPNMVSVSQLQIRAGIKDSNTYWIDQISFYNVKDDSSNAYYAINPPESYDDWYEGVSVVGQDFEEYPGDDDMQFCCDWYFDDTGWIALENDLGNTRLRMDYDFTDNASSILTNITAYKEVDAQGGISFWAKSSIERNYTLKIWFGENTVAAVVFRATPQAKYYKIPFSAFWLNNKININYTPSTKGTITIPKLTVISDSSCNSPAMDNDDKFSLWIDDIKFVDSDKYKRAGEVDHYENGVRLKADADAFEAGVYPSIKTVNVTESEKKSYLEAMKGSDSFGNLFKIDAYDMNNVSLVPSKAVELIFDVPTGINPEDIVIYQLFIDGSMSKRSVTVTEDGKVKASVYRLGNYVLGYGNAESIENEDYEAPETGDRTANTVNAFVVVHIISVLCAVFIGTKLRRKGRQ